jgi:hypothetical protein
LAELIEKFPPTAPARRPANKDELRKLGARDGVRVLSRPPTETDLRRVPEKKGDDGCHLWVVVPIEVPYLLELAPVVPPLESGRVTHTNLTGGAPASCGGELWVDPADDGLLYINGCSGRYGPRGPEQLEAAEDALRSLGFQVIGFGWDDDAGKPAMVLRR